MQIVGNALKVFMKGRLLWTLAMEPILKQKALVLYQKINGWSIFHVVGYNKMLKIIFTVNNSSLKSAFKE